MELTPKGRQAVKALRNLVILLIVLAVAYFGIRYWIKPSKDGKLSISTKTGKPDLIVAYNTFTGVEGIVLMNGGMDPNESSDLYKNFGIKLQIKQMDAVKDTRAGLHSGDLDLVYCTTDALPVEMGSSSELLQDDVVQIMQVNQSHGADAIVVRKGINEVSNLKGKKIAYAVGTASHTLLLNVLETSNMKMADIDGYQVADGVEAANAFKNGQCDAALVWAPDDEDCIAAVPGSKVLVSSAVASQIIADGLLVKKTILDQKKNLIVKLVKAWLQGNAQINTDPSAKKNANALFAKGFKFPEDIAAKSADKVYFSTLGDNINFFGLNSTYTGMTGERMYGRMAVKYTEIGLAKSPAPWRNVSDPAIIQELMKDQEFVNDSKQVAVKPEVFQPASQEMKTQQAQSSKIVKLEFPLNSAQLTEDDRVTVDREIKELIQGFEKAYVRVEGNTDNTGQVKTNERLSMDRANAVVNYLVNEHHLDKNKFIIMGNGSKKPVQGCEENQDEACRARNRRTEFQFIWEKPGKTD
ncbi:MAG TPA: phosphate ABC transporter substrate-binding/OmpA family protein [Chitinophagaceae bacterium]|jgi:ABC-type nitrate/sulfonate/bicarbonate transport systems, periplasmic components|nr:phosphate ABC transporter substrate-binding/OmpA family protein [Chitinophagaceae bacterium]